MSMPPPPPMGGATNSAPTQQGGTPPPPMSLPTGSTTTGKYEERAPETNEEKRIRVWLSGMELTEFLMVNKSTAESLTISEYDRLFVRYVLNQPPPSELVVVGPVPGMKGEVTRLPLRILLQMLDETFAKWERSNVQVFPPANDKAKVFCSVDLILTYPSGTQRRVSGMGETSVKQQTAAQALISAATKNAVTQLGRFFGRDFYNESQYTDDAAESATSVLEKFQ